MLDTGYSILDSGFYMLDTLKIINPILPFLKFSILDYKYSHEDI